MDESKEDSVKILYGQLASQIQAAIRARQPNIGVMARIYVRDNYSSVDDASTLPSSADDALDKGWTGIEVFLTDCDLDHDVLRVKAEYRIEPILAQQPSMLDAGDDEEDDNDNSSMPRTENIVFRLPRRHLDRFISEDNRYVMFTKDIPVTRDLQRDIDKFMKQQQLLQEAAQKPEDVYLVDLSLRDMPVLRAYCARTQSTVTLTAVAPKQPTTYHITIK